MIRILENKHSGFTLIEIIMTLVIVAVVGAGLAPYLGTALTQSSAPIRMLNQSLGLQQVMENMTADYEANYKTDLNTLKSNIGGEGPQNNSYGQYTVVQSDFIVFAPPPPTAENNLLKVTISNGSGNTLTTLFSLQ